MKSRFDIFSRFKIPFASLSQNFWQIWKKYFDKLIKIPAGRPLDPRPGRKSRDRRKGPQRQKRFVKKLKFFVSGWYMVGYYWTLKYLGYPQHRGTILASHPTAPGSNPGSADIFSFYCIVCEQYWDRTHPALSNGFHKYSQWWHPDVRTTKKTFKYVSFLSVTFCDPIVRWKHRS